MKLTARYKQVISDFASTAEQALQNALGAFPPREVDEDEMELARRITKAAAACQFVIEELKPKTEPPEPENVKVPKRKDVTFTVFTPDGKTITSPVVGPGAPEDKKR